VSAFDSSHSDRQIDQWHREAEELAARAKVAEEAGNPKRAAKLRHEAKGLVFKAAKLRGQR
jgi:hypothetical protein